MMFVDTGALFARYDHRDGRHQDATAFWQLLAETEEPLATSNFVVNELLTLLARRTTYAFAAARAKEIYSSGECEILRPTAEDETKAVVYLEMYQGEQVSFSDCISFVLMEREGIRDVFAFDQHFRRAGFVVHP